MRKLKLKVGPNWAEGSEETDRRLGTERTSVGRNYCNPHFTDRKAKAKCG